MSAELTLGKCVMVSFQVGPWKVRKGSHIRGTAEQFPVGRKKSRHPESMQNI